MFSLGLICIKPQVAHCVHSSTSREFKKGYVYGFTYSFGYMYIKS